MNKQLSTLTEAERRAIAGHTKTSQVHDHYANSDIGLYDEKKAELSAEATRIFDSVKIPVTVCNSFKEKEKSLKPL